MSRLFGLGPRLTRCSGWLLGAWVAACGATTEPTWHESARRIVPHPASGSPGSGAHGGGSGSAKGDPTGDESNIGGDDDPAAVPPPGDVDTGDHGDPSSDDSAPSSDDESAGIDDDVLVPSQPDDE